jgi:hypothetical protein
MCSFDYSMIYYVRVKVWINIMELVIVVKRQMSNIMAGTFRWDDDDDYVLFVLDPTTFCDKVCQRIATGRWFSPDSPDPPPRYSWTIVESGVEHHTTNQQNRWFTPGIWSRIPVVGPGIWTVILVKWRILIIASYFYSFWKINYNKKMLKTICLY